MARKRVTRGDFLRTACLGGAALAVACAAGGESLRRRRRHNIVVVLSDDHGYRSVGYTNPAVKTPNLDRLGGEGVIFERAYVATPICAAR